MKIYLPKSILPVLLLYATPGIVWAADPPPAAKLPDPVTITVSRQALQVIGQGLTELPLKIAAPILNDLQAQLNTADKAALDAAEKKPEAAPPSAPEKPEASK